MINGDDDDESTHEGISVCEPLVNLKKANFYILLAKLCPVESFVFFLFFSQFFPGVVYAAEVVG